MSLFDALPGGVGALDVRRLIYGVTIPLEQCNATLVDTGYLRSDVFLDKCKRDLALEVTHTDGRPICRFDAPELDSKIHCRARKSNH